MENILELSLVSVKKQGNLIIVNAMDKHIIVDEGQDFFADHLHLATVAMLLVTSASVLANHITISRSSGFRTDGMTAITAGDLVA